MVVSTACSSTKATQALGSGRQIDGHLLVVEDKLLSSDVCQ